MDAKKPRKRGVNVFKDKLREAYKFMKKGDTDSDVECETCGAKFSIAHGGKSDIETHLKSNRHKKAYTAASNSQAVTHFFKSSTITKYDMHIAACEGVWAYHIINSNHSFRSADYASKIIELVKFSCARTKCEAIISGVIAPYAIEELNLAECSFFTIITDASNHGSTKMFPVVIRFFSLLAWVALDHPPEWAVIEVSAKFIATKGRFDMMANDTELCDQVTALKKYVTTDKIQEWEENEVSTDKRWVECFHRLAKLKIPYDHILNIVSYILCLPGTSAAVERIFSLINDVWSSEKSRISIDTLKKILVVRYNMKMTCLEFYDFLKSKPKLLEEIGKSDKYAFKDKSTNEQ